MDLHMYKTFLGAYGEVKLVVDANNPNCAVAIKCIDLVKHPEVAETARKEVWV